VDCDTGTDASGCGAAGSPPCGTIEYAWNTIGSGGYEIVCFTGTCTDADWEPTSGGNEVVHLVEPTGSQVRAWEYPSEPKMLIGWDTDGDHEFPPVDEDDTSMLDGSGAAHRFMSGHLPTHLELAHFSARQYNDDQQFDDPDGGFVGRLRGWDYFHDIELDRIGNNTCQASGNLTFTFFGGSPDWIAIENIRSVADGGYFIRGAGGDGPDERGPLRFQNLTVVSRGMAETNECGSGGGRTTFIKMWGFYTGVEVLDNVRGCDIDGWNGLPPQWGCGGGVVDVCSQDWDIINNEFRDSGSAIGCQGEGGGACNDIRPIKDVVWDRNIFINTRGADPGKARNSYDPLDNIWEAGTAMAIGSFGDSIEETCQDLTITNNTFFLGAPGWERGLMYTAGGVGEVPGFVTIANNTIYGENQDSPLSFQPPGYILLTGDQGGAAEMTIENNLFGGGSAGCTNITKDSSWAAGGQNVSIGNNVYDADCDWTWDGTDYVDFASWQGPSGDQDSMTCAPDLVDPGTGDFHLTAQDACAVDAGRPSVNDRDIDGDARPQGAAWDVGADERTD
jgi:hypothetical protein